MKIIIDPEFRKLIPPLDTDEYNRLQESIAAEGCRDPLVVWHDILLDGYNRYEICAALGVEYKTVGRAFASRNEAHDWIILNQLARRNLDKATRTLLIGKLYNSAKGRPEDNLKNRWKSNPKGHNAPSDEAAKIAAETHVDPATVKRAGRVAEAAETVAEATGKTESEVVRAAGAKGTVALASAPSSVFDSIREGRSDIKGEAKAATNKQDKADRKTLKAKNEKVDTLVGLASSLPIAPHVNRLTLADDCRAWLRLEPEMKSIRLRLQAAIKDCLPQSAFVGECRRFLSIAEPTRWRLCAKCNGKGVNCHGADGCAGAGYQVRTGRA